MCSSHVSYRFRLSVYNALMVTARATSARRPNLSLRQGVCHHSGETQRRVVTIRAGPEANEAPVLVPRSILRRMSHHDEPHPVANGGGGDVRRS
jgi:hypothetical protein